ncbi:MAG: hypothetical protein J6S65_08720, partial [Bacteroidaceae bacterium]|nr:hypothetical protein [Bacteroidaceae bacterium]
ETNHLASCPCRQRRECHPSHGDLIDEFSSENEIKDLKDLMDFHCLFSSAKLRIIWNMKDRDKEKMRNSVIF